MDLGNERKTHNGDEGTNPSSQVTASTDSKSVAKVSLPEHEMVSPASNIVGKENEKIVFIKSESKDALIGSRSETHGPDAWQPLSLSPVVGDNMTDTSNTNKVPVLEVISPPMDTPSTALHNLDDFKKQSESSNKGNGSLGSKQGSEKAFTNQSVAVTNQSVAVTNQSMANQSVAVTNQSMANQAVTVSSRPSIDGDSEDANRKKKEKEAKFSVGKDFFCWICHKEKANVSCTKCPRSFHPKCLLSSGFHHSSLSSLSAGGRKTLSSGSQQSPLSSLSAGGRKTLSSGPQQSPLPAGGRKNSSSGHNITCPECKSIEDLERKPPRALKTVSKEELNSLLFYVIDSVKPSADPSFHVPVIKTMFPGYYENIINPTDFEAIERKVKRKEYCSTQEFLSDMRWIIHNCCIYNNHTHPLTSNAKSFMKVTTTKIVDLEICPDCFKNFHVKPKTWFTEVCRKAHSLVWAKVIGHPFWPGKVVQVDPLKKEADVRFFGAHDRAWLSIDQCFLITENNCKAKSKNSRSKFDAALKELNEHISKIENKLGIKFPFADGPKVPVDAKKPFIRLPKKEGEVSSEEEEEEEEDLDEVESSELQIDESVEEEGEKESGEKNGSEEASEADSTPQKWSKGAKRRKLSQSREECLGRSKKSPNPPREETVKKKSEETVKKKSEETGKKKSEETGKSIPDGDDPIADVVPLDEKDIGALRKEVERLREMVLKERERSATVVNEEQKKWEAVLGEMKQSYMKEKERAVRESRSKLESAHAIAIAETKKQQWCAQCAQPAVYYCCWNTSYCSYDCQNNHWQIHMSTCQQSRQTQHINR